MKSVVLLSLLVVLLPFESMTPIAQVGGFDVSFVELAALVLLPLSASAVGWRGSRNVAPVIALLLGFVVACLLSAVFAQSPTTLPLKFTLRMMAGTVAAFVAFCVLRDRPRFSKLLGAFAIAGAVSAAVILLEVSNVSFIEALIAPFREQSFEVGGRYRASGTFSYPNIAGGFLALCLPANLYFVAVRRVGRLTRGLAVAAAIAVFAAVLLTYSRGALLGAAAASGILWWSQRDRALSGVLACFGLLGVSLLAVEPSFRWRAHSEGDRSWYAAEVAPRDGTLILAPGQVTSTAVRVTNRGRLSWNSATPRPIHLSYRWFQLDSEDSLLTHPLPIEGARTQLDAPLAPGETVLLEATVQAPNRPGRYVLIWDMVHEHVTWFSDKVGLGSPVRVHVGARSEASPLPKPRAVREWISERSWRPGRLELWGIALRLFRSRPLFGVGPDNFRWLYGPESGHEHWDTRVYANSLYLELLATVGMLGFTMFALAIGRTLLGLRRSNPAHALTSAVLSASLFGFLVHGVFDYLLAPTTMYLAFFVLVGASAALGEMEEQP